jgi:hypothetical protein
MASSEPKIVAVSTTSITSRTRGSASNAVVASLLVSKNRIWNSSTLVLWRTHRLHPALSMLETLRLYADLMRLFRRLAGQPELPRGVRIQRRRTQQHADQPHSANVGHEAPGRRR